jgi:hypothetical protein
VVLRLPYWRLFCRPEASRSSLASVGTTGARPGRSGAFKLANAASRIGAALWPEAVLQPVPGRSPNIWQSSTLTSRFCSSRDDIIRRRCGHLSARPSVSSASVHARRPIGLSAPVVEGVMSRISNSSAAAIFTVNGGTRMARRARRQRCRSTATASTAPRRAQTNPWLGSQPRPTNKRRRLRRPLSFASPLLPHCPELNPQENLWNEIREKIFKNYALKSTEDVYAKLEGAAYTSSAIRRSSNPSPCSPTSPTQSDMGVVLEHRPIGGEREVRRSFL